MSVALIVNILFLVQQSKPVEDYYRRREMLLDFEITGGIPETWPRLISALSLAERNEELPNAA